MAGLWQDYSISPRLHFRIMHIMHNMHTSDMYSRVLEYWSTTTTSTSQYFSSSMCILQVQLVITTRVGSVDTSRKCTLRARSMHIYNNNIILLQSMDNMHTSQQQSLVVLRTNIIHTYQSSMSNTTLESMDSQELFCVAVQYFFGEGFGSAFSG